MAQLAGSCCAPASQPLHRSGQNGASCPALRPAARTEHHHGFSSRDHKVQHQLRAATKEALTYKQAGVDINAGAELVRRIKKLNPAVGGFSGLFPFGEHAAHVHTPILGASQPSGTRRLCLCHLHARVRSLQCHHESLICKAAAVIQQLLDTAVLSLSAWGSHP